MSNYENNQQNKHLGSVKRLTTLVAVLCATLVIVSVVGANFLLRSNLFKEKSPDTFISNAKNETTITPPPVVSLDWQKLGDSHGTHFLELEHGWIVKTNLHGTGTTFIPKPVSIADNDLNRIIAEQFLQSIDEALFENRPAIEADNKFQVFGMCLESISWREYSGIDKTEEGCVTLPPE